MTDLSPQAQAVLDAFICCPVEISDQLALTAALREVVNQLQQSPGVVMCYDILELCDELEAL